MTEHKPLPRCPRCAGGQLFSVHDTYGPYLSCLACGYLDDLGAPPVPDTMRADGRQRKRQPMHGKSRLS